MRVDFEFMGEPGSFAPPVTRFMDLVEGSSFLDQEGNCWTKISPCRARDQRTHESDLGPPHRCGDRMNTLGSICAVIVVGAIVGAVVGCLIALLLDTD